MCSLYSYVPCAPECMKKKFQFQFWHQYSQLHFSLPTRGGWGASSVESTGWRCSVGRWPTGGGLAWRSRSWGGQGARNGGCLAWHSALRRTGLRQWWRSGQRHSVLSRTELTQWRRVRLGRRGVLHHIPLFCIHQFSIRLWMVKLIKLNLHIPDNFISDGQSHK